MSPWLIIVLIVGLVALALAVLVDRRSRARRDLAMSRPPQREIPGLPADRPQPTYVTAAEAAIPATKNDKPGTVKSQITRAQSVGIALSSGWADRRFATSAVAGMAVVEKPLVAVVSAVMSMREVLPLIERARGGDAGLVIVAGRLDGDVIDTLAVNALQDTLPVIAVKVSSPAKTAELLGIRVLSESDLQAGWVPPTATVTGSLWVSDRSRSWFVDSTKAT